MLAILAAAVLAQTAPGPPAGSEPFSFIVVGHLRGDENGELLGYLDELIAEIDRLEPDFLVLTGDLIWGDVNSEVTDEPAVRGDWMALDSALEVLGVPVHRVPGNHDINDLATRDAYAERYGLPPSAFEWKGSRFLLLSSSWIPEDGDERKHPQNMIRGQQLDEDQIAFIQGELAASSHDHAFLFMHHMLWWEPGAPWWDDVHPLLTRSRVRAVFAGDYGPMKFSHEQKNGIHYLQSSVENSASISMLRYRELSRQLAAQLDNFLLVTVDGTDVRYEVRTVGALSTDKFTAERWREINEYDAGSLERRLYRRWGDPARLWAGAWKLALGSAAGGFLVGIVLVWWTGRRRRKGAA